MYFFFYIFRLFLYNPNMFNFIWPAAIIVFSNIFYQICAKGIPEQMNTYASMAVTYAVATIFSTVMYFVTNKGGISCRSLNCQTGPLSSKEILHKNYRTIKSVPAVIKTQPTILFQVNCSWRKMNARTRVSTTLILSIGTTLLASPI